MDKSLFFIAMFLICLWLIADDFVGQKRLSKFAQMISPSWTNPIEAIGDKYDESMEEAQRRAKESDDYWYNLKEKMNEGMPQLS